MSLRRVCVYAGSKRGRREQYATATRELGRRLAGSGIGVVYGGGRVGLMGVLSDAALEAGGEVIGVIPGHLVKSEVAHESVTDLRIVGSMHERKALMSELADAFIALPGGTGTLEELVEMLTWSQLGLHHKPCGLLNVDSYYDSLVAFLDGAVQERFLAPEHRAMLVVSSDADALLAELATRASVIGDRDGG